MRDLTSDLAVLALGETLYISQSRHAVATDPVVLSDC